MESVVETDDINETWGSGESDLVGEIPREIFISLKSGDIGGSIKVGVTVDT